MKTRHYTLLDKVIMQWDNGLKTIAIHDYGAKRPNPGNAINETKMEMLNTRERRQSSGYMRVNHTGEVCAQALYRSQMLMAKEPAVRDFLQHASDEENDHLAWCHERLKELNSHRSYLNFFWYWNSFALGCLAGFAGDAWSLGFVEETEKQVGAHLEKHLRHLPQQDEKSRCIVKQMHVDEAQHGASAAEAGARELPIWAKTLMTWQAKVMTTLTYWV